MLLAQRLRSQERTQIRGMVQIATQGIASQLQRALDSRVATAASIAGALGPVAPGGWERFASAVVGATRRGVGWVPALRPASLAGAYARGFGSPGLALVARFGLIARAGRDSQPAEAVIERDGRLWFGLLARSTPIGAPPGMLWIVSDLRQTMSDVLASASGGFLVVVRSNGRSLIRRGQAESRAERVWGSTAKVTLNTINWEVTAWPRSGALTAARSTLPIMTLAAGTLVGVLLGLAMALGRQARERTRRVPGHQRASHPGNSGTRGG